MTRLIIVGKANTLHDQLMALASVPSLATIPNRIDSRAPVKSDKDGFRVEDSNG